MKKQFFLIYFLVCGMFLQAQTVPEKYIVLIRKADTFYRLKNYKTSAQTYSQAFKIYNGKVIPDDRYNAACSWALAGIADSSFSQLNLAAENGYNNITQINSEHDLSSLHKDKRWKSLLEKINKNNEEIQALLNRPLIKELDSVENDDQVYRVKINELISDYGEDSREVKELWKTIHEKDSVNLIKVKHILDTYGWLGPEVITDKGSTTLFLVIQHSDQQTQEYYLPMMREAVKKGKARADALALLEDRVALGEGRKQIYGTQIVKNRRTGKDTLAPVDDFKNVDRRRAEVGLGPLSEYLANFGIDYLHKTKKSPPLSNCTFETALEIKDSIAGPFNVCKGSWTIRHIDTTSGYNYRELNNDAWFKFTFNRDTILTFDIVPVNPHDDYDFFLFKCPGVDCFKDILSRKVRAERFCYSYCLNRYGSTGLTEYTNVNYLGAGNAATGYVAALPVKAGETYYLMIGFAADQSSSKGFTIYFHNYWRQKSKMWKSAKPFLKPPAKSDFVLQNVLFESDKTILLKESFVSLDKLIDQLNKNKTMKIEIIGHTDNTGNEMENQRLSDGRAKAVAEYLISKNIDKNRLSCKGLGSKYPLAPNDTEEGKQKNRRVEFRIIAK